MERAACIVTFVGMLLATSHASALPLEDIIRQSKPAVVHLSVRNSRGMAIGNGSGFVISPTGKVATCHHVIAGARDVEAVFDSGERRPIVGVWAMDTTADVAILQLPPGKYASVNLTQEPARQGQAVTVIGSPLGFSGTVSTGIVSAVRVGGAQLEELQRPQWQLQMTAAVSPGSSGSPILNEAGDVVGIAVGVVLRGQALNFGVPARELSRVAANPGKELRPLSHVAGRDVRTNILISAAGLGAVGLILWGYTFFTRVRERRQQSRARALLSSILRD
jgi:S1-C subfamily serine protease